MTNGVCVIAIGCGGFTHGEDPALESYCLRQLPDQPQIGFIGAASQDNPDRIARFYERFRDSATGLRHLPMTADAQQATDWVQGLDMVYVGGGNTAQMLAGWRATGIDAVLLAAARAGVVMAGVSAGAVCWFEYAMWDGNGTGFRPLEGLGLIAGSCCPHYSSEPARRPAFRDHVAGRLIPAGLAIDDGAAVRLGANGVQEVFSARPGAGAYALRQSAKAPDGWQETPINSAQ